MIKIHDKCFVPYIKEENIIQKIKELAKEISTIPGIESYVFMPVLNGSFRFVADLVSNLAFDPLIDFIKIASYEGTQSTSEIKQLIGLKTALEGKNILIIEDIVDTGHTIEFIYKKCHELGAKNIKLMALLHKPTAQVSGAKPDFVGFSIENKFVVGYGLDYDGLGRTLNDILVLK